MTMALPPHYDPHTIETAAQQQWQEANSFQAVEDPQREKFYCLSMFPYPSGRLHMGHVRNYTIGDVISRYQRMLGKCVLQPMGWDAFGLPAENAAQKHGVPPAAWTRENIDYMRQQLQRLGFGYDWERELATCDPDYYRWEQWLFLKLYEKGLVYKKCAAVNWDPVDQTVLANEQVIDGRGWRSGALVERREIPQWFMKISAYADELLADLDQLPGWPERVRTMQRNWIGRSEGVEVIFNVIGSDAPLKVYTTRPDTLMGVSYLALAPEHPLALAAAEERPALAEFIAACRHLQTAEAAIETMEKRGVDTGLTARHPISGATLPIYAANFVLMGYGEGAVMAVPAHDQRDWEFAQRYQLPVTQVIAPLDGAAAVDLSAQAYTERGRLIHSGQFDGLTSEAAFSAIADHLAAHGQGQRRTHYRLRDWGVSRQRYWGCPIPIIHCPSCGEVPVPEADLPVVLPEQVTVDGSGSPLRRMATFYQTRCPRCGAAAERETDTFDTFMESSWYFARYTSPDSRERMLDERANYWLPVDQYIGGIEHAILHLLYARFYHKLLRDEGLVQGDEPFTQLLTQGMVVAETYYREEGGQRHYTPPAEVTVQRDEKGRTVGATLADGTALQIGAIEKMSKSKNNGVDPQALIERYGADTVRLFTMFAAPPEQSLEWNESGVEGAYRFLKRLWGQASEQQQRLRQPAGAALGVAAAAASETLQQARRELYEILQQALTDFSRYQFNTVVAGCMKLLNLMVRLPEDATADPLRRELFSILLRLLAPIAPHMSHHLWRELGYGDDILQAPWPEVDESALVQSQIEISVQVNGKMRGRVTLPVDADQAAAQAIALADANVARFLEGKSVRRVILVPGRLINIVVG